MIIPPFISFCPLSPNEKINPFDPLFTLGSNPLLASEYIVYIPPLSNPGTPCIPFVPVGPVYPVGPNPPVGPVPNVYPQSQSLLTGILNHEGETGFPMSSNPQVFCISLYFFRDV